MTQRLISSSSWACLLNPVVAAMVSATLIGCGQDAGDGGPGDASETDAALDSDEESDAAVEPIIEPVVDGSARFTVLTDTLIRLEYAEDGVFEDRPTQLVGTRSELNAEFEVSLDDTSLVVQTASLTLRYTRNSGPFGEDNLVVTYSGGAEPLTVNPRWGELERDDDALGGWLRGLDLIGAREELEPGLLSRRGWTLLDDTNTALLVDEAPGFVERPRRDGAYQDGYFFGYGTDFRGALADLRHLTGPAPLVPRNSLGVWFSRYYAYSADEWRGVVQEFASRDVPLDVLSLDTDWKRPPTNNVCDAVNSISGARPGDPCSWNGWDWNYDIFPDPAEFIRWAAERGIDVGLNIHPSINAGEPQMNIVESAGAEPQPDIVFPGCQVLQADLGNECLVFDFLDAAQIEAYFALHAPIAEAGIDFWWFDWCCERTGRQVPGLASDTWINQLYYEDHRELGSRWPAFSRIGSALEAPEDSVNSLGALAEHRQTLHFTGDTCSTWELLEFVAEFTVAEGAMGLPYVSHDIGSFHGEYASGEPCEVVDSNPRMSDEMYVRWVQFGTFQPFDRLHSNHGDRLPWEYPGEAETIGNEFLRLRSRLVPHLYTLSREAYDVGLPLTRALYLGWPDEQGAYEHPAQFTLGDDLLVATVASAGPSPTIDVWIPPGTWHHLFSGETFEGPQVASVAVPLDEYPVFGRAGSILPLQTPSGASGREPQDDLTLVVWAGGNGEYSLYEDEGTGFGYEQGALRRTPIASSAGDGCHVVTIGAFEGESFPGALDERTWTIELRATRDPSQVSVNGEVLAGDAWSYDVERGFAQVPVGPVPSNEEVRVEFGVDCE